MDSERGVYHLYASTPPLIRKENILSIRHTAVSVFNMCFLSLILRCAARTLWVPWVLCVPRFGF